MGWVPEAAQTEAEAPVGLASRPVALALALEKVPVQVAAQVVGPGQEQVERAAPASAQAPGARKVASGWRLRTTRQSRHHKPWPAERH